MNALQIFNNTEFGEIRTIEIDGKPYFVATDVAAALGYTNPRKAVIDHCRGVTKRDTPTCGGNEGVNSMYPTARAAGIAPLSGGRLSA